MVEDVTVYIALFLAYPSLLFAGGLNPVAQEHLNIGGVARTMTVELAYVAVDSSDAAAFLQAAGDQVMYAVMPPTSVKLALHVKETNASSGK